MIFSSELQFKQIRTRSSHIYTNLFEIGGKDFYEKSTKVKAEIYQNVWLTTIL